MKKIYILISAFLLALFMPSKVNAYDIPTIDIDLSDMNATSAGLSISCPIRDITVGDVISCSVSGTSTNMYKDVLIKNISFNLTYDGLTFVSFEPDEKYSADSVSASSISLSVISGVPGKYGYYVYGTLKVKVDRSGSSSVTITDFTAVDTNDVECKKSESSTLTTSVLASESNNGSSGESGNESNNDNNSLTSVIFDGYDINFNKDKLNYEFTISDDIEKLMYCVNKKVDNALCFSTEGDFDSKNMKVYFNDKLIPYFGNIGDASSYEYDESTGIATIDLSDGSKMKIEFNPNDKFAKYYINDELIGTIEYVAENGASAMMLIGNLNKGTNVMKIVNTSTSGKEKTYTFKINRGEVTSTDKSGSNGNSNSGKNPNTSSGKNSNTSTDGFGTSNSGSGKEYDVITSSPATGNVVSLIAMFVLLILSIGAIIYSRNVCSNDIN